MAGLGAVGWIIYAVVIIAMFYFLGVRPQQQEKKKLQDLMSSLAVGDTVLTSSGFYGVIIDLPTKALIERRADFVLSFQNTYSPAWEE